LPCKTLFNLDFDALMPHHPQGAEHVHGLEFQLGEACRGLCILTLH
jgi:hypothetical protein